MMPEDILRKYVRKLLGKKLAHEREKTRKMLFEGMLRPAPKEPLIAPRRLASKTGRR